MSLQKTNLEHTLDKTLWTLLTFLVALLWGYCRRIENTNSWSWDIVRMRSCNEPVEGSSRTVCVQPERNVAVGGIDGNFCSPIEPVPLQKSSRRSWGPYKVWSRDHKQFALRVD